MKIQDIKRRIIPILKHQGVTIHPLLRDIILKEQKVIYEEKS